jgi:hypothetical protein
MVIVSRVKYRKYARRTVSFRRNADSLPDNAIKYIHKSAAFAGMMSDIGIERIEVYVRSMADHAEVLAHMINTGVINEMSLAAVVESISNESEKTGTDLAIIGNSLVRFMHTDSERNKSSRVFRTRMGNTLPKENEQKAPGLPGPLLPEAPETALAVEVCHE